MTRTGVPFNFHPGFELLTLTILQNTIIGEVLLGAQLYSH